MNDEENQNEGDLSNSNESLETTSDESSTSGGTQEDNEARRQREAEEAEAAASKAKAEAEKQARLPGEADAKDKENAKKLAKIAEVKTNMRLKAKGFVANKKLGGFVFPGIDPKILRAALRKQKRMSKRKK